MNQNQQEAWVQDQPYTVMLQQYSDAADRLRQRLQTLKLELKAMQNHKKNTLESANAQRILERRIDLLHAEYYEITSCMRDIGFYAEKEQN